MAFVPNSNHPQPLWRTPPTAYPTASGAASEVPSLLLHPWGTGFGTQKFAYQKWQNKIFPFVNFLVSHDGHFGLPPGGGGGFRGRGGWVRGLSRESRGNAQGQIRSIELIGPSGNGAAAHASGGARKCAHTWHQRPSLQKRPLPSDPHLAAVRQLWTASRPSSSPSLEHRLPVVWPTGGSACRAVCATAPSEMRWRGGGRKRGMRGYKLRNLDTRHGCDASLPWLILRGAINGNEEETTSA